MSDDAANIEERPEQDPKTGRPTKYDPAICDQVRKLCRFGLTDLEIADWLRIHVATLYRWKNDHDEFCEALKEGKDDADARVEASLYHKAVGYSYDAVKIFMPAGADEPVYAPYREHVPPSDTAAIFWLKNRQADKWRDKQDFTHTHTHHIMDMTDDELIERIRQLDAEIGQLLTLDANPVSEAAGVGGTPNGAETKN